MYTFSIAALLLTAPHLLEADRLLGANLGEAVLILGRRVDDAVAVRGVLFVVGPGDLRHDVLGSLANVRHTGGLEDALELVEIDEALEVSFSVRVKDALQVREASVDLGVAEHDLIQGAENVLRDARATRGDETATSEASREEGGVY